MIIIINSSNNNNDNFLYTKCVCMQVLNVYMNTNIVGPKHAQQADSSWHWQVASKLMYTLPQIETSHVKYITSLITLAQNSRHDATFQILQDADGTAS